MYTCKWCGEEKAESEFYRCAINHKAFICKKCINHKYDEICAKREKVLAVIICCHYLDIAFYKYIYDSLGDKQGIGYCPLLFRQPRFQAYHSHLALCVLINHSNC